MTEAVSTLSYTLRWVENSSIAICPGLEGYVEHFHPDLIYLII